MTKLTNRMIRQYIKGAATLILYLDILECKPKFDPKEWKFIVNWKILAN